MTASTSSATAPTPAAETSSTPEALKALTPTKKTKTPKTPKEKKEKAPKTPKAPKEKPETKKRSRVRRKDPLAPKRAKSAYMFFYQTTYPTLRGELTEKIPITEIAKQIGARWKVLSEADKHPYQKKASADKERYEAEKKAYTATAPVAA